MELTLKQIKQPLVKENTHIIPNTQVIPQKDLQVYLQALQYSQLKVPEQIQPRHIRIYDTDHIHEIGTNNSHTNLPHLVLLHGFGGSALHFVRIFAKLEPYFQIHALDLFGMGYSSLGNFNTKFTCQQAIEYYINAIQQWRKKVGIEIFQLVGHSFGGYISAYYATKYKERVSRLVLLSPAGFNKKPQEVIQREQQARTFGQKFFHCVAQKVYNMRINPSRAMTNFFIGNKMKQRILSGRLQLIGQEKEIWNKYLDNYGKKQKSSQQGFYIIFQWPVRPKKYLIDLLKEQQLPMPIELYYGDTDWIEAANNAIKDRKVIQSIPGLKFEIIDYAGHQLIFQNPNSVALCIIKNKDNCINKTMFRDFNK